MTLTVGVDFDSYRLHLCGLPNDGGPPLVEQAQLRRKGDDELVAIQSVSGALAGAIHRLRQQRPAALDQDKPEGVSGIWIERGYGTSRKADFILGAIYGATIATGNHACPGVSIRPVNAARWKQHLGCAGNCAKPVANAQAAILWRATWPLAIIPTDPNVLDAFSIAHYAATL